MTRSSIIPALLAVALLGAGCKKDPAQTNPTPAPDTSGVAATLTAAVAAVKSAVADDGSVKFSKKALAAGAKRSEASAMNMNMKLTFLGKTIEMKEDETGKKSEEILEVDGDKTTKIKVTFVEDQKVSSEGTKPARTKTSKIAGKTYVVVAKDGKTTVLDEKEKPAPAAEAKLVAKKYGSLGKPDPLTSALPDRALKPGDAVPELAAGITTEMKAQADDKMGVEGVNVVFKGKDGDAGVFDVEMTMKIADGPFRMSMPLKGTMSLRMADGWPKALDFSGPLNLDLNEKDKAKGVDGSGSIKLSSSYTYP